MYITPLIIRKKTAFVNFFVIFFEKNGRFDEKSAGYFL